MLLKANKDRIYDNLNTLSTFNSCPEQEGITRALFSEAEIGARSYVKELMTQAGLLVTEDAIGNIFEPWLAAALTWRLYGVVHTLTRSVMAGCMMEWWG